MRAALVSGNSHDSKTLGQKVIFEWTTGHQLPGDRPTPSSYDACDMLLFKCKVNKFNAMREGR